MGTPSSFQIDALKELINVGIGKAANLLNQMVKMHVDLSVPTIRVFPPDELDKVVEEMGKEGLASVNLKFDGKFSGTAALVFPPDSALKLVSILTGDDMEIGDLDEVRVGTLNEVGNIMLNGVMGSIANVLKEQLQYSIPAYLEGRIDKLFNLDDPEIRSTVVLAQTKFVTSGESISGEIILVFEVGAFDFLMDIIDSHHS